MGDYERLPRSHPRRVCLALLRGAMREVVEALTAGESVLDFGCGERPYEKLLRSRFSRYTGADLPGSKVADVFLDAEGRVPLPDSSFDCVLSSQVLEHCEDPGLHLGEARRLLRPGGSLVLSTHGVWMYHPQPRDCRRWTLEGLKLEIERSGFEIAAVRSVMRMASVAVQLWQDATDMKVPWPARGVYRGILQTLIGLIEWRPPREALHNAAVYVVHALKAAGPPGPR